MAHFHNPDRAFIKRDTPAVDVHLEPRGKHTAPMTSQQAAKLNQEYDEEMREHEQETQRKRTVWSRITAVFKTKRYQTRVGTDTVSPTAIEPPGPDPASNEAPGGEVPTARHRKQGGVLSETWRTIKLAFFAPPGKKRKTRKGKKRKNKKNGKVNLSDIRNEPVGASQGPLTPQTQNIESQDLRDELTFPRKTTEDYGHVRPDMYQSVLESAHPMGDRQSAATFIDTRTKELKKGELRHHLMAADSRSGTSTLGGGSKRNHRTRTAWLLSTGSSKKNLEDSSELGKRSSRDQSAQASSRENDSFTNKGSGKRKNSKAPPPNHGSAVTFSILKPSGAPVLGNDTNDVRDSTRTDFNLDLGELEAPEHPTSISTATNMEKLRLASPAPTNPPNHETPSLDQFITSKNFKKEAEELRKKQKAKGGKPLKPLRKTSAKKPKKNSGLSPPPTVKRGRLSSRSIMKVLSSGGKRERKNSSPMKLKTSMKSIPINSGDELSGEDISAVLSSSGAV